VAEKASKLKTKINKSRHKLRLVITGKYALVKIIAFTKTEKLSDANVYCILSLMYYFLQDRLQLFNRFATVSTFSVKMRTSTYELLRAIRQSKVC